MQGVGNAPQTQDGGVTLALFNLTDVGMAQSCVGRQCSLREALLLAMVLNGRSKKGERCLMIRR